MTDLPFDPETVTIPDLAERLEGVLDEDAVHELQRADTRKGAAAVYERRVDAIRESQQLGSSADPEPEPPADTDEDRERGYRITSWAGHPNYECLCGKFPSLNEAKVIQHQATHR